MLHAKQPNNNRKIEHNRTHQYRRITGVNNEENPTQSDTLNSRDNSRKILQILHAKQA